MLVGNDGIRIHSKEEGTMKRELLLEMEDIGLLGVENKYKCDYTG